MLAKPNKFERLEDFKEGTLLLFDKPLDWTSFDVVNKVRGMLRHRLKVRKLKVGHAGTLDPKASGLLVICTGKMTKEIQFLTDEDKGYTGTMKFGATTASYDVECEEANHRDVSALTAQVISAQAKKFEPSYMQRPPDFSAKKVDGKTAYELARKGQEVKLAAREVRIIEFDITHVALPFADFDVSCSKGTYIRSLAHDLGEALGTGAYLSALRRYRSGGFHVNDAMTIESFEERLRQLPPLLEGT